MDHSFSTSIPFSDLPEGTVTFLFTDIEGSTRLLEQLREGYATLLADQRRLLREAFTAWQGREVDTQGDAFFVAFSRATQAACAAVQAQRALAEHTWPDFVRGAAVRVGPPAAPGGGVPLPRPGGLPGSGCNLLLWA
jgi:class 3 adenylate cyclase